MPFTARVGKYIKEHGHEPSFDEFYDYNHQKTGGEYVDGRSKDARIKFEKRFAEYVAQHPATLNLPKDDLNRVKYKLWVEMNTDKNSRVYGFGSRSTHVKRLAGIPDPHSVEGGDIRSAVMRFNAELEGRSLTEHVVQTVRRELQTQGSSEVPTGKGEAPASKGKSGERMKAYTKFFTIFRKRKAESSQAPINEEQI